MRIFNGIAWSDGFIQGNLVGAESTLKGNAGKQGRETGYMDFVADAQQGCRLNDYKSCLNCLLPDCQATNWDLHESQKHFRGMKIATTNR